MTAKVAALTAAGQQPQEPDAGPPAAASGQHQRAETEAAWALPGALELPDGSGKPRMMRRGSSVNSLAKTASQHMRGKSYAPDSDGVPSPASGTASSKSKAAASWKQMGVKSNMLNALKRQNLEHRAIYGTTEESVSGIELGAHGQHIETWARGVKEGSRAKGSACLLSPECRFRQLWDALQVILLFYVAIAVPLNFAFDIEKVPLTAEWWVELFVDLYFICDICLNFRTGFHDEEHQLVMHPRRIAMKYLRGWFPIDVVACLPLSYINQLSGEGGGSNVKAFKTLRLFRLAKLLRLARIRRIIKRWEESIGSLMALVKLTAMLLTVLFMTHVIACSWYFIGENNPTGWVHTWDLELEADGQLDSNFTSWQQHARLHKYLRTCKHRALSPFVCHRSEGAAAQTTGASGSSPPPLGATSLLRRTAK